MGANVGDVKAHGGTALSCETPGTSPNLLDLAQTGESSQAVVGSVSGLELGQGIGCGEMLYEFEAGLGARGESGQESTRTGLGSIRDDKLKGWLAADR
jgi:hypothetical protein